MDANAPQSSEDIVRELHHTLGRAPRICILSLSAIPDDPRVRRQGDAFQEIGWSVVAVGLPGWKSPSPTWPVYSWDDLERLEAGVSSRRLDKSVCSETSAAPELSARADTETPVANSSHAALQNEHREDTALRDSASTGNLASLPLLQHARAHYHRAQANLEVPTAYKWLLRLAALTTRNALKAKLRAYHALRLIARRSMRINATVQRMMHLRAIAQRDVRYALLPLLFPDRGPDLYLEVSEIQRYYRVASHIDADVYLANDWHMLPVAMKLANERSAQFGYDTHEYALEEYKYRLRWRLTRRPMARAVEAIGLRGALVASTVSRGIGDDMQRVYGLSRRLIDIRNVPTSRAIRFSPPGEIIEVLYHGIIVQDRGLEECIRSVPYWRQEFRFVLRGPSTPEYRAKLENLARQLGVVHRVHFAPAVPMTELVAAASASHIGISTPPKTSKHNIFALPNKFFEYIHAGLAVCVADLPDMSQIVRQFDLGRTIKDLSPASIAAAINGFDHESIKRYRQNSCAAAKILNWEQEKQKLTDSYSRELLRALQKSRMASSG